MTPPKLPTDFLIPKAKTPESKCQTQRRGIQLLHKIEWLLRGVVFLILVAIGGIFVGSLILLSDRFVASINSLDHEPHESDSQG